MREEIDGGADPEEAAPLVNVNETNPSYSSNKFQKNNFSCAKERAGELNKKFEEKKANAEPLPLQRELPTPEPFPLQALGKIMEPVARKIVEIAKVSDAICGGSLLSTASLCVQGHRDVGIDGRQYPLSEFFLTIAMSGDRKSTADKFALKSIHRYIDLVLKPEFDELQRLWENKRDACKARRNKLLRICPDNLDQELADLKEPRGPLEPYILCDEPTIAGLEHLFFNGRPSLGLFSDEGARFFGGFSMSKEHLANTVAVLSKFWDGAPHTRIRKDERFKLSGRRLCSHLMLQPVIFKNIVSIQAIREQGVLARYLIAWPPIAGDTGTYNATDLEQDPDLQAYWQRCNDILDVKEFPLKSGTLNELEPKPIQLSPKAKKAWQSFYESVELDLGPSGRYRPIYSFAKKSAEHALRIAGICEAFNDLNISEISLEGMERAIVIVRWYLQEALRINGASEVDQDLELAQKVLEFLQRRKEKQFPLWVIYKDGPSGVRNKKSAEKMIQILCEHERVRSIANKKNWWELV